MMKRTILSVAVLAASVAGAGEVSSSNVLGILPITSSAKRTIVSVPWCAMSATDDTAIQVSNLVKTANLTAGDMLHYVNSNGSYLSWRLSDTDVKYWESVNIASDNSVSVSPEANSQTVARGNSIILIRQNPGEKGSPNTFYLYGQVGTNATVTTSVAQGGSSPAYTLIASPSAGGWSINDISWSNVGTSDEISFCNANGKQITLIPHVSGDSVSWGRMMQVLDEETKMLTRKTWTKYETAIPAGQGVWYVSYGGNPTITWNNVPTK